MADPSHRPGSVLLGTTSQVAVDVDGYVILHDPEYLRLDSTSDDTVLIEQSLTEGLLLEPYDCICCGEFCGECTDEIPANVTIDLGITGNAGASAGYYDEGCDAACSGLAGEFIVTRRDPEFSYCAWQYTADLCVTHFVIFGAYNWSVQIDMQVGYTIAAPGPGFAVSVSLILKVTTATDPSPFTMTYARYRGLTTTVCTGKTYTLPKYEEVYTSQAFLPCTTNGGNFEWPDSIDVIVP